MPDVRHIPPNRFGIQQKYWERIWSMRLSDSTWWPNSAGAGGAAASPCDIVSDIENGAYYISHISRLPQSGERNGDQNI